MDKTGSEIVNSYNNGSEVNQNSKNVGSFNTAGGDMTTDAAQTSTTTIDNSACPDGNCDETDGPDTTGVDTDYQQCEENGGWYSTGCSCHTHYIEGKC